MDKFSTNKAQTSNSSSTSRQRGEFSCDRNSIYRWLLWHTVFTSPGGTAYMLFEDILFGFCQEHRTQLAHVVFHLISPLHVLLTAKVSFSKGNLPIWDSVLSILTSESCNTSIARDLPVVPCLDRRQHKGTLLHGINGYQSAAVWLSLI